MLNFHDPSQDKDKEKLLSSRKNFSLPQLDQKSSLFMILPKKKNSKYLFSLPQLDQNGQF